MKWLGQFKTKGQEIRDKILKDPYYRFQSQEEIIIAAQLGIRIDVNQASVDDWLRLPGISIHQARSLVELSKMGVQFLSVEDLAAALNISVTRLKPLAPVLNFCYYDPDSLLIPQKININTAGEEEIQKVFLLSPELSQKILKERQKNGAYRNLVDFQKRLILSGEIISQLMHYISFD